MYIAADLKAVHALVKSKLYTGKAEAKSPIEKRVVQRAAELIGMEVHKSQIVVQRPIDESRFPVGWEKYFSYHYENAVCKHYECACDITFVSATEIIKVRGTGEEKTRKLVDLMVSSEKVQVMENDCAMVRGKVVDFFSTPVDFFGSTVLAKKGQTEVQVFGQLDKGHLTATYVFYGGKVVPGYKPLPYKWKDKTLFVRRVEEKFEYTLKVVGRVYSSFRIKLKDYCSSILPVSMYPLKRERDGWKVSYKEVCSISLAVDAQGNYTFVKSNKAPSFFSPSVVQDFIKGLDVPPAFRTAAYKARRLELLYEVKTVYQEAGRKSLVQKIFSLPEEVLNIILWYYVET
jgi:hypothetical protein